MIILETQRLILRTWEPSDAQAYWAINQDPKVTEFLLGPLTMEQVNDFMDQCNESIRQNGFGLFATERKDSHEFIGFIGLSIPKFEAHFTPAVEIGWRLGSQFWGQGYATEGAKAVLDFAFNTLKLNEIVSFTAIDNHRSRNVMKKLGLHHNESDDFPHPKLPLDHPLSKHVLYRIDVTEYRLE